MIAVKSLCGEGRIPKHRTSATNWLKTQGISIRRQSGKGGETEFVHLSDLPDPERLAFLRKQLTELHLDPGTYDDAAHETYAQATPAVQERAERKAAVARLLVSLAAKGVSWPDRLNLIRERFPDEAVSKPSLKRILATVKDVDPINYGPALLPGYKGKTVQAEISPDAWRFFLTTIRDAAPEFPLIQAWRDARDAGSKLGWAVPSYPTFYRRWHALSEAQRLEARHGRGEAVKRLSQPVMRDKTSIGSLEWVSLDGRMQDFWVDWGDGRAVRPVMLALVDVATNYVLGWELAPSENAAGTVKLIKRVCERHGIFDRLYTDNGPSFAGHLVAGGNPHRFRNGRRLPEGIQPLGICHHMGIKLHFALPRNAQAKIAERAFAVLSRVIDDRPEFKGAHAGHAPGASPSANVVPVSVSDAGTVIRREIERHNRETGRRNQGAQGRSYEQMFRDGLAQRVPRKATARQLYLSGLIYNPVAVDRWGRVQRNGWVYGGPATQDMLLRYHGNGKRVLLGRDPDDFNAPAIAFDEDGRLICEGIEPVQAGAYGSVDGIRDAARNGKAARVAVAAGQAANDYLSDEELNAAWSALNAACEVDDAPLEAPQTVVAGRFNSPLRGALAEAKTDAEPIIPEEFIRNRDTAIAAKLARGGKPA